MSLVTYSQGSCLRNVRLQPLGKCRVSKKSLVPCGMTTLPCAPRWMMRRTRSVSRFFLVLRRRRSVARLTHRPAGYLQAVNAAVASGEAVPADVADKMANAIRAWAEERGAVNYTHIFYPLRAMKSGQKKVCLRLRRLETRTGVCQGCFITFPLTQSMLLSGCLYQP